MVALSCIFVGALGACEGAQVRRLLDKDAVPDTTDTETDVTTDPSLEFWLVGKEGELGRGVDTVTLSAADEADEYTGFPGFQIDLAVETSAVAADQDISLFIDGTLAAVARVTVTDGVGTGEFRSVTIPDIGTPVIVRLDTVDTEGGALSAEKSVGFEANDCEIFVQFDLGENQCIEVGAFGATVFVTRESGTCEAASATATIAGVAVELGEKTFDDQGELFFEVALDGAPLEGEASVEVTALLAGEARGTGSASGRFDAVAPGLTLDNPSEDAVVTPLDDADSDPSNGLQYEVRVDVGLDAGETATLTLTVDDAPAVELDVTTGGPAVFPAVELTQNGATTFVVVATDGCGNEVQIEREVLVLSADDQVVILSPDNETVLLAAADGDTATTNLYETTFEVVAPTAGVGTTVAIECRANDVDPWIQVGGETLAEGEVSPTATYPIPVVVDVAAGSAQSCRARVDLPNEVVSSEVAVTFGIPPGELTVTSPLADTCVTTPVVTFEGNASNSVGLDVSLAGEGPEGAIGPVGLGSVAGEPVSGTWSGTFAPTADGAWTFVVSSTDTFGNPISAAPFAVTVDRLPPALSFVSPGVTLNGTDVPDSDTVTAGYQTAFVVGAVETTSLTGGEICIAVNGAAPICQDLAAEVTFVGVTLIPGANTVSLTGRDGCGNPAPTLTRTVTLTFDNNLSIVAPSAGSTLLARDDGNAATARIYETTFTVDAPEIALTSALRIECRTPASGQTFTSVGSITVGTLAPDGRYTVPVAVDTAVLGTELECRASANLPAQNESSVIAVTFGIPAPTALITAPTAGACLADDFAVSGTTTGLDGRVVSARLVDGGGAIVSSADATVASGAFTTLVTLTAADGEYMATVAGADAFGNQLADGTPPMVPVTVDRTAPEAVFLAPLGSFDEAEDVDTAAPGIQAAVDVQIQDENPTGEVCLVVNGADAGCVTAAAGVASFAAVTLQPGPNSLVAVASDVCGNNSVPAENEVLLLGESPIVLIDEPAADLVTVATTLDIVVSVADAETNAPLTGLAVSLYRDDVPVAVGSIDNNDGTYRFPAVPLTAGSTANYVAVAVDFAAIGTSAPRAITQKNRQPVITVTTPANGSTLNLVSTFCEVAGTTCVGDVVATTVDAEDGSEASITVDCGAGPQQFSATVSANSATFDGVGLTHGATCTLVPSVTDLVAQTTTGATSSVTIDRVAPNITITTPVGSLLSSADQDLGTDGIQAPLRANVGGIPANTTVSARLTWNGGADTRTLTTVVANAVAEGGSTTVSFEDVAGTGLVTWPDGVVVVTVAASDAAGNPGSATRSVSVVTGVSVRITGPTTPIADACTVGCGDGQTCSEGTCWLEWGVNSARSLTIVTSGLETSSNNVRVCSDDPALAGPDAIECDSAPSTRGPFYQVATGSVGNGVNALDVSAALADAYHRLVVEVQPLTDGGWVSSLGSTTASERERRVFVDLAVPVVVSIRSPSDTLAPTGALNAAEQAAVPRVFSISYEVGEAGTAALHVNGTVVDTRFVNVGTITFNVTLPEGNPQIWVVLTDSVNNASPANPGLGATTYEPLVDVTAPTLAFARPNASPLRQGDNLDVVLTSNAEGQVVTVSDAGVAVGTATVTGGVATLSDAAAGLLTEGTHTLTANVSDAAGNPAPEASTTPATILVDTLPPLGVIIDPPGTIQFTDLDDADSVTPGFQVRVEFSTNNGAETWSLWTAKGCNIAFNNCQAPLERASGAVSNPGAAEPAVFVTLDLDSILTQHKIMLRTTDNSGNTHDATVNVQVLVLSCAVSFRNLPAGGWYNATACGGPSSCAQAATTIQVGFVGPCGANRVTLYNEGTEVATINNPGTTANFPFTVTDGVGLTLEARAFADATQLGSTGVSNIGVDLVPPTVAFIATDISGFTTPAEGQDYTWTTADDVDVTTDGLQFNAAVQVSDANVEGGSITVLSSSGTALTPTNGAIPFALTGLSPLTQPLFGLTLPGGGEQTVLVTARDIAGNTDSSTFTAVGDGSAPDAVSITASTVDARRPLVGLTWTAVGDDGSTGLPAGYEVRYSRFAITEDNWASACDASLVFGSDVIPAPATAGTSMNADFGAPDTRGFSDACKFSLVFADGSAANTPVLYMGVRAIDDIGNLSPLGADSIRIITRADIENRIKRVRFSNSNGVFGTTNLTLLSRRGSVLGDINNDGRADWASYSANAQAFCLFAGLQNQPDDLVVDTLSSQTHACLLGSQMGTIFTGSTQTGHFVRPLGDVNGDGINDIAVAGKIVNGAANAPSEAYMLVYFGRDGALPDLLAPNIRIRGIRSLSLTNEYIGVCSPGDFDGTGAVKTNDIAFGEPFASRVHVIPGRTTWTSTTNLTINLTPVFPTPSGTALVDNGAWTVETTGTWGITGSAPAGSPPTLGLRCGSAGDVLPTPAGLGTGAKDDLFVHQSGSLDARIFVFPGREWTAGTVVQVSECVSTGCVESPANVVTAEDGRAVRLRQDTDKLCQGFGGALQGGSDLNGDGSPDFLATLPLRSFDQPTSASCSLPDGKSVFVFDGSKFAAAVGQDLRVNTNAAPLVEQSWTGTNGWALRASVNGQPLAARVIGDFDGWEVGTPAHPTFDIAIGNRLGNTVAVRLNHVRPGLTISEGQFPVVDGEVRNPNSAADNSLGEWIDGGVDLTGDGLPDFLTGARTGEVLIIH